MRPRIQPIGIGDLKVVKQKLVRYEGGEVAHIENVMASESRSREHRRLRQTEEIFTSEIERTEENVKDLQSTERFEMQQETQKTIKSDTRFEAGVEVSGGFGPVQISAFARFSTSASSSESERNATNYAKDITERSLNRIVEKVREQRTSRSLEEFEEINKHGFENSDGGHLSGIYRWIDKYYRAKVVNYGKRLMYEFIIPEPAAFFIFAQKYNLKNNILPLEPSPPTRPYTEFPLSPSDLTRTNYLTFIRDYSVEGVEPPPALNTVIAKAISRELPDNRGNNHWAFSDEGLRVPKGYIASQGFYRYEITYDEGGVQSAGILIGINPLIDFDVRPALTMSDEDDIIPISGNGFGNARTFIINIEVLCTLREETFKKWQLRTYSAIMNAFHKQRLDYEEKLTAIEIQQGTQISGRNPTINREIEREELKKSCITLWTGMGFNLPASIVHTPSLEIPRNYPEINNYNAFTNAEQIQFFEQAFDWKNLTYEFYPYYWGRKNHWLNVFSTEDNDPLFEQFLRAGAARVLVPVNLAFSAAVLYYQMTGRLWSGGDIPSLGDPTDPEVQVFNAYLQELEGEEAKDDIDRDVNILESDQETWMIKVPTNLIWLQPDSTLPSFE